MQISPTPILDGLLDEPTMARELGKSIRTLRYMRQRREIPFITIGKTVYYPADEARQSLRARVIPAVGARKAGR